MALQRAALLLAAVLPVAAASLSAATMNDQVKAAQYAVRGPIVAKAGEIDAALASGEKMPFSKTVACNIGNPQALRQRPLSFHRQVLSLILYPEQLEDPAARAALPDDVVARAEKYMANMPNVGAYTHSQGLPGVRKEVTEFIARRDGTPVGSTDNVFLTNGASEGVRMLFQVCMRAPDTGVKDGVLVPIPQYPLYSALTTLCRGEFVPYHLNEAGGWSMTAADVKEQLDDARARGINVRGLVVINPGNPTGNCLSKDAMKDIIQLCADEGLVLMADEVYQNNIWTSTLPFHSFRKVAAEMGFKEEYDASGKGLQLVSFHSCSKGFLGECGLRGGYFELFGIDPEVRAQIVKLASISLCSNTLGQLATGLMVRPPAEGEPSYPKYKEERDAILSSLQRRAEALSTAFGKIPGMSCQPIAGALYAFPSIDLPKKYIAEAEKKGQVADAMYCMSLLEETGIVCVPGSGFGQEEGTYHFRTTILPSEDDMPQVIESISRFHKKILKQYK